MKFVASNLHVHGEKNHKLGFIENVIGEHPDALHSASEDGVIIIANRRAVELYGYPLDELIGMSIFDLYLNEEATRKGFIILKKRGRIDVRTKIKTKDGELLDIHMKSFALVDEEGKFVRTFSILRDMTEHFDLKRKLLQASRLTAIGKFSAGIAHDIRSPLTIVKGFRDYLLESGMCADERSHTAMNSMDRATTKIENLVTQLLHFPTSGIDEALRKVNINDLVEDILEMLETRLTADKIMVKNLLPAGCVIDGKQSQLEQVFNNVIINACDAVRDTSERKITLKGEHTDNGELTITISDTGGGIPENLRKKVFDFFFTTKEANGGGGIGLSIAHEIVTNHQGKITLADNYPQGMVFSVTLPRQQKIAKAG